MWNEDEIQNPKSKIQNPLVLRGHHLLCLQAFHGVGYSRYFVRRTARLKRSFLSNGRRRILLTDAPDDMCLPCPHLGDGRCTAGRGAEERIARRDRAFMRVLGFRKGSVITVAEMKRRFRERFTPAHLEKLCATCPWRKMGDCERVLWNLMR